MYSHRKCIKKYYPHLSIILFKSFFFPFYISFRSLLEPLTVWFYIILFGIIIPLTLALTILCFTGGYARYHWYWHLVSAITGIQFTLFLVLPVIFCSGGVTYLVNCHNVQSPPARVILYLTLGPLFTLLIFKTNRFISLVACFTAFSFSIIALAGSLTHVLVIASGLFFCGLFLWIHLISYWFERMDRENFLLRDQIAGRSQELSSQIQATREAEEKGRREYNSKKNIVSFIFHEVRVPFNTLVLGLSNMETDGVFGHLKPDQLEVFEVVKASVQMMENVLNDVLDFQKMEEVCSSISLCLYTFYLFFAVIMTLYLQS